VRILIVDDEAVSLTKLQTLLAAYGDCDVASNGEQAFEMFKKAQTEAKPYSLVTMDIQMPGMNGQDAVAAIRDWEKTKLLAPARIVMVTVASDLKVVSASMQSGADAFLVKPFNEESIREVVSRLSMKSKLGLKPKPPAP
jgi:two-component system, chemotaxis family, chemotaxis protein CheY